MTEKSVVQIVRGQRSVDGAGVQLTRVLGTSTIESFDPFLMLDSFDSTNPEDYIMGFPQHPHRGIETITYLADGLIEHEDSLGNKGAITPGDAQWMTAGSGILHQEMPKPSNRMLGLQFWLNLPKAEKMTTPKYFDIKNEAIPVVEEDGASIRVIAGKFRETQGAKSHHIPATFLDIALADGATLRFPSPNDETSFVFLLEGDAKVAGQDFPEKTAVLLKDGDTITIEANQGPARLVYAQAKAIHEPVAWGGPIVMNTREEVVQAFADLQAGTFIQEQPK